MKMIGAYVTLAILYMSLASYGVQGSTKTEFECIDIHKQPAFQHPKLKNHKIQMEPSFKMKTEQGRVSTFAKDIGIIEDNVCQNGSVPIQRKKNGLMHPLVLGAEGRHFATLNEYGGPYRGAGALISVEDPSPVMNEQGSGAFIWLQSGQAGDVNEIMVGWMVQPSVYYNNQSRLTGFWRGDDNQNGCYNYLCKGFIQTSRSIYFAQTFSHVSSGSNSFSAKFHVVQDYQTQNWWFWYNDREVGYWPKELFTHLNGGATGVAFGGATYAPEGVIVPPMGRGSFPKGNTKESASFEYLHTVNNDYQYVDLDYSNVVRNVDSEKCYNLIYWKVAFTYGGPGGNYCGI